MKNNKLTIKSWAKEDRPREKLLQLGRSALSDAELIAIILGSGSREESAVQLARRLLSHVDNHLASLAKLDVSELKRFKGIGEAKSISIVAALELGRRRIDQDPVEKFKLNSSFSSFELMKAIFMDKQVEEFWIVLLDRSNQVISKKQISTGGVSATVVDSKVVFKYALLEMASGLIMFHNHPSGSVKPSRADISLTQKLQKAGALIDIKVFDHLIISDNLYFSFADEGLM